MSTENRIAKNIKEAINDHEHSIGEKAPGTPFALVALSYLTILAVACLTMAFVSWLFG